MREVVLVLGGVVRPFWRLLFWECRFRALGRGLGGCVECVRARATNNIATAFIPLPDVRIRGFNKGQYVRCV